MHYWHALLLLLRTRATVNKIMMDRKCFSRFSRGAIGACPFPVISVVRLALLIRPRAFNSAHSKHARIVKAFPRVKHMTWLARESFSAPILPEFNVLANFVYLFLSSADLPSSRQIRRVLVILSRHAAECPRFR
jgi:hypothetical protein